MGTERARRMVGREGEFGALIAELKNWNNGRGISPTDWISCVGTYEMAIGYSLYFWPRFEPFGPYIFRGNGITANYVRDWETACSGDGRAIEAVINHLHIADLHVEQVPTESQVRYLGRTLREAWRAKLCSDFPGSSFEVVFNDEPGLDLDAYELTFWQSHWEGA